MKSLEGLAAPEQGVRVSILGKEMKNKLLNGLLIFFVLVGIL